ncbi:MAG: sodium-dependent transporter [Halioglobus sp.]
MNPAGPGARDKWGTRTTFVLALLAATMGLGNLWRFSYLSGEYGGGAFVISYVLCLFLIAVPVLVAELVLGNYGGPSPVQAIRRASDGSLRSRAWLLVGALACLTGLLVLTLYVVVAGWGIAYAGFMNSGIFSAARAVDVGRHFEQFLVEPMQQVYWQSLFLLCVSGIIVFGVRHGLGVLAWLATPLLLAMLAFLIVFAFDNGDIGATRDFLFSTRLVDFTPRSVLVALGHAFFTLGVGVGTGISYGAYAPERIPIGRSVMAVAVFDTVIALLAGLAIYPVVFANNMEPASGPGLVFVSLPYAFGNLMQGELGGTVFFAVVVLASLGSAVAIMEPLVAMLMKQLRLARFTAALLVGAAVWLLALVVVMSFVPGRLPAWLGQQNLLGVLDLLTARVLLPAVAMLVAVFVGWRLRPEILRLELARESGLFFSLWRFLLRYIAPLAIALIMLAPYLQAQR